jgi:C4-dicarboxylate-specific signal transduction histidine kinase
MGSFWKRRTVVLTMSQEQKDFQKAIREFSEKEIAPRAAAVDRTLEFPIETLRKGTGLGLSVCYGIVDSMGGVMEVSSQRGMGTTFTIRLPAAPESKKEKGFEEGLRRGASMTNMFEKYGVL